MNTKLTKYSIGAATLLLISLAATPLARADSVDISVAQTIAGSAADTIAVFGNLTNNSFGTLYFSNDSFTVNTTAFTATDDLIFNGFFLLGPSSIDTGSTLTNVDLFTVQIAPGATPGVYTGNFFDLIGGSDPVACGIGTAGCNFDLGNASFSVTVNGPITATPEPGTILLLTAGLAGIGLFRKRAYRRFV
jgi:hypothetical protein